jgi:hypothetical protein
MADPLSSTKYIVAPSPSGGCVVTSVKPDQRKIDAQSELRQGLNNQLTVARSRLGDFPATDVDQAMADDRAVWLKREQDAADALTVLADLCADHPASALAKQLYPSGEYVIVDAHTIPPNAPPQENWTLQDGQLVFGTSERSV